MVTEQAYEKKNSKFFNIDGAHALFHADFFCQFMESLQEHESQVLQTNKTSQVWENRQNKLQAAWSSNSHNAIKKNFTAKKEPNVVATGPRPVLLSHLNRIFCILVFLTLGFPFN